MKAVHKRVDLVSNKKLMKTLKSTQVKTVTHHLKNETETKYLCFGSSKKWCQVCKQVYPYDAITLYFSFTINHLTKVKEKPQLILLQIHV